MKLSLNWIRQYVDLPEDLTMEQLSYDLTMRTVEVESTQNPADSLKNVVVGRIVEILPHPQADLLRVCHVDIGRDEPATVVCGGSNLSAGMLVVVAVPGSFVRWHGEGEPVEIKAAKLRGVRSEGMICAAGELDMGDLFPAKDDHEIMDLSGFGCKAGDLAADVLELNDMLLEIDNKSMTNRPDLWGHYGIARELAAIYGCPLKPLPAFSLPENVPHFPVSIEDPSRCLRYVGAVYEGLNAEQSPYWLRLALWKTGIRPINALVDLTNFVMLAVGQPTHGFDKNHIQREIIVRTAREQESLTLLDGQELKLSGSDLMICDALEPVALAGIMGGAKDSILPETTAMILEVATFEPIGLRRSASKFHIRTEAAIRNEKGLDTQRVDQAIAVADNLIHRLFPDARMTAYGDCYPLKTESPVVSVPLKWLSQRLGRALSKEQAENALTPLGFVLKEQDDELKITVPSWRATGDVSVQDDILEEVARMIGYENFDFIPPTVSLKAAINQRQVQTERSVREYLAFRCGMQEVYSYPWVEEKFLSAAGIETRDCLALSTPPSPETEHLRNSLVPGLLSAAVQNLRYFDEFRVFEMTQVFSPGETHPNEESETLPLQRKFLAGALVGHDARRLLREMKGVLEEMPRLAMTDSFTFGQHLIPSWADRKAWLNILSNDEIIGSLCVISPKTARLAGIKRAAVAVFEMNFDKITPFASRTNTFEPLAQFPLVEQDFSVLVDEQVPWSDLRDLLIKSVKDIAFLEEYRGTQVPDSKKSVLFRVWFGSDEGTLTSEKIEEKMNGIIKKVSKKLGGEIRN